MGKEYIDLGTMISTRDSLWMVWDSVKVFTNGSMGVSMMENGKPIKWMEEVYIGA